MQIERGKSYSSLGVDPGSEKHGVSLVTLYWNGVLTLGVWGWEEMADYNHECFELFDAAFVEKPTYQGAARSGKYVLETSYFAGRLVERYDAEVVYSGDWRKALLGKHNASDAMVNSYLKELGLDCGLNKRQGAQHINDATCIALYGLKKYGNNIPTAKELGL